MYIFHLSIIFFYIVSNMESGNLQVAFEKAYKHVKSLAQLISKVLCFLVGQLHFYGLVKSLNWKWLRHKGLARIAQDLLDCYHAVYFRLVYYKQVS